MQQTGTKGIQDETSLGRKGDSVGIEQDIKIWPLDRLYAHELEIVLENQTLLIAYWPHLYCYNRVLDTWHSG